MAPKRQPPGRRSSTTTCLPSPRPGNRQPRRNCAESNWFGWPETSAAVRPMLPGRKFVEWFGRQTGWTIETRRSYRAGIRGSFRWAYRTKRVPDHLADQLPKVREQRGQRGRRGRGPTAYEAICLTSGLSSASTGIICSVRSVCALHTTHCRPNVTFRIGLSGNNLWKQSKQIF
jgi:hypothetical protein